MLVIYDMSLPRKGRHSVGLRLVLPTSWTDDAARMARAGVPDVARAPRTKPEIALDEVDHVRAAGTRFGLVLADAGYGCSATFRSGLRARGLAWAVGFHRTSRCTQPT